jgi:hypothetical protein
MKVPQNIMTTYEEKVDFIGLIAFGYGDFLLRGGMPTNRRWTLF